MAYTTAQLVSIYTNANLGKAPDAATQLLLEGFASGTTNNNYTDAQALSKTLDLLDSTTTVAILTRQFFAGAAPSAAGLAYIVNSAANPNDLNDASGALGKFSQENRFINLSVSLATGAGEGAASFAAKYGAGVSYVQAVTAAYDIIIGNTTAAAAGVDVPAAIAYLTRAENITFLTNYVRGTGITTTAEVELAVKAALIGQILNVATVYNLGAYSTAATAMLTDLSDGVLSSDSATGVDITKAYPSAIAGQTFNLTTGVDTFVGGGGADVFNANTIGGVSAYGALDSVDGGAGEDTLNIADAATAAGSAFSIPAGAGIKNIETINVATTGYLAIDASTQAGLTKLSATSASSNGTTSNVEVADTVDVIVSVASGDLFVAGGKTAVLSNQGGEIDVEGDALTTVTVTTDDEDVYIDGEALVTVNLNGVNDAFIGNNGEATITTVNANGVTDQIEITAAAGERALTVNLNDYTGNYVLDDNATTVTVNVTGDEASFELDIDSAETLTVGGTAAAEIDVDNQSELTAITVTNTAGVSITSTLGVDVAFTGGEGADSVIVAATTQAINLGAGDDTVEVLAAPATGGSINGGAGTDTLKLSAALAETLSATTGTNAFSGKIDGFEKLSLGQVGNAEETVNLGGLDNINYVILNGDTDAAVAEQDTVTFSGLSAGQSVTVAGRTVTATATLSASQVASAFSGLGVAGATVTGTLTGWTQPGGLPTGVGADQIVLTSTTAGAVSAPTITASPLGTAPSVPSVSTTNGVTATSDETAEVTFTSLTAGQSVTVGDETYTAAADVSATTVAAYFANVLNAPTGWTVTSSAGNSVLYTSTTAQTNVTNLTASSAGVPAATAPTNAETRVAVVGSALVLTNLAANSTLELTEATAGTVTATLKDASGSADVINLVVKGSSNIVNTGTITVAGVETVNITTTDSSATTNPTAASDLNLVATSATKVTVSGNHGVDFTGSTLSALTTLDASGVVGTGTTAAAQGASGAVTFASSAANLAMTVTTGNGNDFIDLRTITATNKSATISTGAGNDTVYGTSSADTINVGAGADTVYSSTGTDTVTLGAGNDTFVLLQSTHSVLASSTTITDFSANTVAQSGADSIKGATLTTADRTGDVINLTGLFDTETVITPGVVTGIKVQVASNAADAQTIIQNISTNDGTLTGIVLDSSTGKVYIDFNDDGNVDSVITLTGVTTLTTAAFVTGL